MLLMGLRQVDGVKAGNGNPLFPGRNAGKYKQDQGSKALWTSSFHQLIVEPSMDSYYRAVKELTSDVLELL